jgi:pilus assembly protein CpaE
MPVLVDLDPQSADILVRRLGPNAMALSSLAELDRYLVSFPTESVVVLAPSVPLVDCFDFAERMRVERPTLGVILVRERFDSLMLSDALRAGVREVVARSDLDELRAAAWRAAELASRLQPTRQLIGVGPDARGGASADGLVVTVFSAKGGCGKTTLATNLGAALASTDRDVCVLDLDLAFGDVAIALQLHPAHTIADASRLGGLDEAGLRGLLTQHSRGLSVLAAPTEPGAADQIEARLVGDLLRVLRRMFDVVIIDTPAAFSDQVLAAFDATDLFLLIATLDIPALKNLKLTLETMDLLNYPRDRWRVVLNRADAKVGLTVPEAERALHTTISAQIPSSRSVPISVNRGVALVHEDPTHPVSQEIRRIADSVMTLIPQGAQNGARSTGRRGLLRRKARNS